MRRARLFLNGDWTLVVPLEYSIELGYSPNKFVLSDAWLLFPELKYVGPTKLGQFQPPQGLDVIGSSWAITFMEPAAPLQALAPGTNAGIQVGRPVLDNRATWRLGIFGNGAGRQGVRARREQLRERHRPGHVARDSAGRLGRITRAAVSPSSG